MMPGHGRILAIETASEACSVALFERDHKLAHDHRVLGRGHAEALVPMIAALPDRGRAHRILVSLGPGSFTGVRIGIAAARALGVAWQADVAGYPTLALIATQARTGTRPGEQPCAVTVCMNGGHGEWFVQNFDRNGLPECPSASLPPNVASTGRIHACIVGNRARELAATLPAHSFTTRDTLPDAATALSVPPSLLTRDIAPIYGRAPDATAIDARGAACS